MRRQQLSAVKATRDVSKTATTSGLELMYLGCNMWRSGWGQMPSADVWGGGCDKAVCVKDNDKTESEKTVRAFPVTRKEAKAKQSAAV